MNKGELIEAVADRTGQTKVDAAKAIDAVFDSIVDALAKGDTVGLAGFGSFVVRARAARNGRNPQTGEPLVIKASRSPAFKPGKSFKDAVDA